jgi:hypothetical protein
MARGGDAGIVVETRLDMIVAGFFFRQTLVKKTPFEALSFSTRDFNCVEFFKDTEFPFTDYCKFLSVVTVCFTQCCVRTKELQSQINVISVTSFASVWTHRSTSVIFLVHISNFLRQVHRLHAVISALAKNLGLRNILCAPTVRHLSARVKFAAELIRYFHVMFEIFKILMSGYSMFEFCML